MNNSNRVLLTLAIASLFISAYFPTSQKLIAQTQTFSVVDGVVRPPNSGSQRTESSFTFPEFTENTRLTARFQIAALDDNGVDQNNVAGQQRDPFDRAGYFYFRDTDDGEIELIKFITGFGGSTSHERDITDLLPKLSGKTVELGGRVTTFTGRAWGLTGQIIAEEVGAENMTTVFSDAVIPVDNLLRTTFDEAPNNRLSYTVNIPELPPGTQGYQNFKLLYFVSGHSGGAGSGGDEFITRTHRIFVNGAEVDEYTADNNQILGGPDDLTPTTRDTLRPWRNFGTEFRSVNPTSGRFFSGGGIVFSSDFARSGWKPGDDVRPVVMDVTDMVQTGQNTFELEIEDVTPEQGNWRVSAYISGQVLTSDLPPAFDGDPADLDQNGVVDYDDIESFRDVYQTDISVNALFRFREFPADFDGNSFVDLADAKAFVVALNNAGMDITVDQLLNGFSLGDVNRDGNVSFLDISPFIELLTSNAYQFEADINKDNVVSFLDISSFIGLLTQ